MNVETAFIPIETGGNTDIIDLTDRAAQTLRASGLLNGIITFFVSGSTAGLTTIEFEPGLLQDMPEAFDKIAPSSRSYHHDATWHDGNGHSHVRAALLGPSLTVPFQNGKLLLGTWQQIVLVDFDNRPRSRKIVVQMMGV
jgi:secondary thiamine-phosphate synthase enzyme